MPSDSWSFREQSARFDADEIEKEKQKQRRDRETALIFAILIGAFAAFGLLLLANSSKRRGPSQISDCVSIGPKAVRLACFDKLSRASLSSPFKGAPPAELDGKK
jgi:hypothetical protein